ncbi:hypothetical protein Jiend_48140 [Micromonospora endophytica]|nr:hypothetical protein Jiend_48140 [Micromonospora endophytica]
MTSQPTTKATPHTDIAMTRRRPPSGDTGGSAGTAGWGSVTADIADKVNGCKEGPPANASCLKGAPS